MALRRMLVVSLSLILVLGGAIHVGAGVSMVSLGGRVYIDATSLAAHIGAKVERTPERLYLRTRGHLVTLTRGWSRVEVDGKPVVLDAPVRVEHEQWLVPEAFSRQVLPLLDARSPGRPAEPPKTASAPASAPLRPAADPRASSVQQPHAAIPAPAGPARTVAPAVPTVPPAPSAAPVAPVIQQPPVATPAAPVEPSRASAPALQPRAAAPLPAPVEQPRVVPFVASVDQPRAAQSRAAAAAPAPVAPPQAASVAPVTQPQAAPAPPAAQPQVAAPAPPAAQPQVAAPAPPAAQPQAGPSLVPPRLSAPVPAPADQPRIGAPAAPVLEPSRATASPAMAMEAPRVVPPAPRVVEPSRAATPAPVAALAPAAPSAPGQEVPRASEPLPAAKAPPVRVIEAQRGPTPPPARVAAVPPVKDPAVSATLEDLRLRSYPTFTRLVVETSAMVSHRVEAVTPRELRIRLGSLSTGRRAEEVRDGIVEDVHLEPIDGDAVLRVTFTGASQEPKVSALSDPPRLLFDFGRAPEPGPRGQALGAPGPLRTLVLDAGHGGHDPGATGPAGLMEKDLVLDVTRRVAALVEARLPGIRVLLSRKSDYFVPLRERTSYANRERADLFVSIHANAHREAASEGVETYFLSSEATDNAARQVAAAENSVVKLERPSARGGRADVVKAILWDLAQSGFQQESSRLAEVVQDSMTQSLKIPNRGVKQAGFYVLGGAAMPAVLVEIGFVTNPKEERKLKESSYRDEIALAIFAGIAEYKRDVERRASRAAARQP